MYNEDQAQTVVSMKKAHLNIEKMIKLNVEATPNGYTVTSSGMAAQGKPELTIAVKEGWYLATACRIINDTARYIITRNREPKTGQRVQLGPWTVVEFQCNADVVTLRDGAIPQFLT